MKFIRDAASAEKGAMMKDMLSQGANRSDYCHYICRRYRYYYTHRIIQRCLDYKMPNDIDFYAPFRKAFYAAMKLKVRERPAAATANALYLAATIKPATTIRQS